MGLLWDRKVCHVYARFLQATRSGLTRQVIKMGRMPKNNGLPRQFGQLPLKKHFEAV
jgi:hypothetical protein